MRTLHIDPNSAGGDGTTEALAGANAAFSSRQAWESFIDGVLSEVEQGITHRNGATADTTALTFAGSTTTSSNYIELIGDDDYWCGGIDDSTKDILTVTDANAIACQDEYIRIIKQQINLLSPTANTRAGVVISSIAAGGSDIRIERCLIKGSNDGTYYFYGVVVNDADVTAKIANSIIFGMNAAVANEGVRVANCTNVYVYNNTVYRGTGSANYGYRHVLGTGYYINNIADNATARGFVESGGTMYLQYCSSSDATADDQDGDGTSGNNHINHTFTFVDAANGDYHLGSTDTGAIDLGTDLSGDGSYPISVDIDGVTRSGTWDIGADEYVATATGGRLKVFNGCFGGCFGRGL